MLTAERVRELLHYDPETGLITWAQDVKCGHKHGRQVKYRKGEVAGYVNTHGYVMIGIEGREYRAHRLAYAYMTGKFPSGLIDHKNEVKNDNRWSNLREADKSLNGLNVSRPPAHNSSGFKGVYYNKRARLWIACIKVQGKRHSLGCHRTPEAAHAAYLAAKLRLVPELSQ